MSNAFSNLGFLLWFVISQLSGNVNQIKQLPVPELLCEEHDGHP